ncbi:VOC family protein [Nesterenkonia marinintestina]|uniref:VOC family protein n=1 Tax=Nesterenkonia marinintestina TaxID=2979865 RepID=UPI0021BF8783|nr:VOC family protein [Nesterenkonia sp. GX14115]
MRMTRRMVVLDAADIDAVSSFWAQVLGIRAEGDHQWRTLTTEDGWEMAVQHAPDHTPPQWPDGAPEQVHLDFYVDDVDAAHDHVTSCGALMLQDRVGDDDRGFIVYADPAGHPFCLCWES